MYVSSVRTSQRKILDTIEKVTGNKWTVENVNTNAKINGLKERLSQGDYSVVLDLIAAAIIALPL